VPLSEPLSGFFKDEYERFMRGLDSLTLSEREKQLSASRRDRANAALPRVIELPGWDDVVHVRPRLEVTSEQRRLYYQAQRSGAQSFLAPEVKSEIQRREARREAMGRSPQPDFDRAWGSVMTAVDNVQDLLGAVSVFGRIALTIGGKIGIRFIPGIGQVVLAANVLSLAMFIGQIAFPGWLTMCAGFPQGARAAIGTAVTAGTFKGATALASRGSARALTFKGGAYARQAGVKGLIGAVLVVAQTTDSLFGIGLSLGPIVGGTMGAVYGGAAKLRGENIEIRPSPSAKHFGPRIQHVLDALPTTALLERIKAADVFAQAALVLAGDSPATDHERLLTLMALHAAIGTLRRDWKGSGWQDDVRYLEGWRPAAPRASESRTPWWDFPPGQLGQDINNWPTSWGGPTYDVERAAQALAHQVPDGIERLMTKAPDTVTNSLAGVMLTDATEALWLFLTDDPDELKPHFTPDWTAAERMASVGFIPHPVQDEAKIQRWWDSVLSTVENSKHGMKRRQDWVQSAEQYQVFYFLTGPPTYS